MLSSAVSPYDAAARMTAAQLRLEIAKARRCPYANDDQTGWCTKPAGHRGLHSKEDQ